MNFRRAVIDSGLAVLQVLQWVGYGLVVLPMIAFARLCVWWDGEKTPWDDSDETNQ